MKKFLLYSLLFTSILASCKKSRDEASAPPTTSTPVQVTPPPPPAPTTGTLTGNVPLSGTAISIRVTGQSNSYAVTPDILRGIFNLQNMAPGTYTITYIIHPPRHFRPDTSIQLAAGQTIDLGTLVPWGGSMFKGTVSPAGSLMYVQAGNTQAGIYEPTVITPISASAGVFTTSQLQPGTYRISFSPAYGYKLPSSPVTLTVGAGEVVDLGTVTARPNMLSGISFDGRVTQTYASPLLNIASEGSSSSGNSVGGVGSVSDRFFTLTMDDITGVGTYPCNRTATSEITYKATGFGTRIWSTNNPGGSGTVVVTSIDPVKKEIKGTFTATLVCNTAGVADRVINNGSFYFAY